MARALQFERRYAWAFANYGVVLVELKRYEDALAPLQEALRLDVKCAAAHVGYGNAMLGLARHVEAQAAYERALSISTVLPEPWSNRGNALLALGRPADALISFDRALELDPHNQATHTNRGHALRDLGRHEEALRSYRLALVARPRVASLLALCGAMLLALGREAEALASFDEALDVDPHDLDALYNSCVALDLLHHHSELLERSERILTRAPDHAAAWLGKANALQGLQRYEEAAQAYDEALARDPDLHNALSNQEFTLRMLERYEAALEANDQALARTGTNARLLFSRANTLQQLGRFDDALACFEAVLELQPADTTGWILRGGALQHLMRFDEAVQCHRRLQELEPKNSHGYGEEAYCQLLMGNFSEGWRKYEYRWLDANTARGRRHADRPFWSGRESVAGKTVLLHFEQGLGDTLQFCRYAELIESRGASVVLEVQASLKEIVATMPGERQVIAVGDPLPEFDLHCPLLSLPLVFETDLQSIPAPVPYLFADAARAAQWKLRLQEHAPLPRLKVGIAWSGNASHNDDMNRSIRFSSFAPLQELDLTLISLHQEVRERDTAALAQSGIVHFGAELRDFADTAALIEDLDLVISVDTSVAHLAGALGKPVWVLLPRLPDWRWMLDRDDSPWYPSARLFRQGKPGNWLEVIERVAHELSQRVACESGK
jgi:tetratricopeptide (TPR) repeat protein